jgi:hypothetical protein
MDLNSRKQSTVRLILIATFALAMVLIVSALISGYILQQSLIKNHAESLSNLAITLAEHAM